MDMREGHINQLRARFKQYTTKIADLKTRAQTAEERLQNEYWGVVDALEQKRIWIGEDIRDLELIGESGWEALREDIENGFRVLDEDYRKAMAHLH